MKYSVLIPAHNEEAFIGKKEGKRFKTITRAHIITSCRKFDTFGDWYLFKNPGLVWKIIKGDNQQAADLFYYHTDR